PLTWRSFWRRLAHSCSGRRRRGWWWFSPRPLEGCCRGWVDTSTGCEGTPPQPSPCAGRGLESFYSKRCSSTLPNAPDLDLVGPKQHLAVLLAISLEIIARANRFAAGHGLSPQLDRLQPVEVGNEHGGRADGAIHLDNVAFGVRVVQAARVG